MEELIIHLLKSAGVLCIFYIGYFLFLKNETSFRFNRIFLLSGIFASILIPFVNYTKRIIVESSVVGEKVSPGLPKHNLQVEQYIDLWQVVGTIYILITCFFLVRFVYHNIRIINFLTTRKSYSSGGYKLIKSTSSFGPCSFFHYIIFDPDGYSDDERKLILEHEMVHSRQFHTVDILISNLLTCIFWFNPFSWLYKNSIIENLEYIADKETTKNLSSTKDYQRTLLKLSFDRYQPSLTISFYKSFIKKRIVMLNKNKEERNFPWKACIIIPFVFLYMIFFNVRTEAMTIPAKEIDIKEFTGSLEFEQELVEINFRSNTTRAELKEYEKAFNQRNVTVKFDQVQYSPENLLQSLRVTYSHTGLPPREYNAIITDEGEILPFKIAASFNPEGHLNTLFFITEQVQGESDKPGSKNAEVGDGLIIKDLPEDNE